MSVVVSDTSPLHYLILCGAEGILPKLFQHVVIPPMVFRELQQPNTPPPVKAWAASLPPWAAVRKPTSVNLTRGVDAGEREAICLAQEINAAALLMDDRAGRLAAQQCGVTVIGTVGLLEQAAVRGLVDLLDVIAKLRQTNARLDPSLLQAAIEREQARKQSKGSTG